MCRFTYGAHEVANAHNLGSNLRPRLRFFKAIRPNGVEDVRLFQRKKERAYVSNDPPAAWSFFGFSFFDGGENRHVKETVNQ